MADNKGTEDIGLFSFKTRSRHLESSEPPLCCYSDALIVPEVRWMGQSQKVFHALPNSSSHLEVFLFNFLSTGLENVGP